MKSLVFGCLLAAVLWFFMFSPFPELAAQIHHNYFWIAMSFSTFILALYSLIQGKSELSKIFEFQWKYIPIGILHAVVLYVMSRFGVWLMMNFFDWTMPQIQAIYQTRAQASPMLIAPLLFFLIAPAEEIFWRGFAQRKFIEYFGKNKGTAIEIALYCVVHIWAMNPMLLIAALVLGVHWSMMYRRFGSVVPGIISHALWDTFIFVVLPVQI